MRVLTFYSARFASAQGEGEIPPAPWQPAWPPRPRGPEGRKANEPVRFRAFRLPPYPPSPVPMHQLSGIGALLWVNPPCK